MYENVIDQKHNKFYPVKEEMITEAQNELGISFPEDLIQFYQEFGYGFLKSDNMNFNRIMDPGSVSEFRQRTGQFANSSELEIYDKYERDKLVFFEVCEGYYLSMGFSKKNNGAIFDGNTIISKNLKEFLIKYQNDEQFFI